MYKDKKSLRYVSMQFALFTSYIIPFDFFNGFCFSTLKYLFLLLIFAGLTMIFGAILQLKEHLSIFPDPVHGSKLIKVGFFGLSRHPIYTGIVLGVFGYALYSCSAYKLVISIMIFLLLYFKSKYEEELLVQQFTEYTDYQKRVGRFFPKIFS